jgi:HEAT repeats/Cytochrome c552/Cytochrome c554 and c-prime/Tetratricopeptide repeat
LKRALALLLLVACNRAPSRPAAPAEPFVKLPSRDAYAGSEACRDCHQKNYDRWSHDWHSRALAKASDDTIAGRFANAHFKGESSEAWMSRKGDAFVMRTRNRDGQLVDYPVEWVIGAKRMQDAATVFPDGRWQVLPVYFHITGKGAWVDYNEAKQGKVGPDHPYFWTNFRRTANKECLECHATGVDVRYDRASHTWSTSFVDAGVACEACHGPGARHAETKAKSDIFRSPKNAMDVCARCHGPHEPLFPLLVAGRQFRPGERYTDKYEPLVVTDGTERSGEFFADGRPSSSSFEYQAVVQSRCYRLGGATCLACHTAPHQDHLANELRSSDTCHDCHRSLDASHAHHAKATCVDCHMPKLVSGVLDKFPDHTLDIPNPANTLRHGVPNACTQCHADKTPAALQAAIERWWPSAAQRQARRIRLADAIDEKTREQSLPALEAVLADGAEAPTLRGACAVLLGQRFPAEASHALVPLLSDATPQVRAKALEALGYARARDAAEAIAPLTNDASIEVRQMAALVLASFGDPRGGDALERLAGDPATRELVRPHIMLGIRAANRGDYDRANRELGFAVREVPYAVDALVLLGDIAARRGDYAKAKSWFDEALRFDPAHRGAKAREAALNQ